MKLKLNIKMSVFFDVGKSITMNKKVETKSPESSVKYEMMKNKETKAFEARKMNLQVNFENNFF
jgi:hypothetical protein